MDDGELADGIETPVGIETPAAPSSPADSLPEEVTDDDIFGEEDFETLEKEFPADDSPYWDVEESHELDDEDSPPRRYSEILESPRSKSSKSIEWTTSRIACGARTVFGAAEQARNTDESKKHRKFRSLALITSMVRRGLRMEMNPSRFWWLSAI